MGSANGGDDGGAARQGTRPRSARRASAAWRLPGERQRSETPCDARRSSSARARPADAAAADAAEPAGRAAGRSTTRAGRSIRRRCASRRSTRRRPSPVDDGRGGARDGQRGPTGRRARGARSGESVAVADTPRGLVWVSDQAPGIRRIRVGDGFAYVGPDGKRLRKAAELQRIRALAIPPAYEDVWICVRANGHLQATGRDARGRKQYRYHPDWRLAKDADKFERMLEFGAALPRIRKRVAADLAAPVGTKPRRDTVLATIVRLLDTTYVRIGNEEYARENKSFGLTTLRNRHAAVSGDRLRLRFRGKSGKEHEVAIDDPRVAKRRPALPGDAGPGAVPVRRRGRRGARRRLGRGQRLHPRCERRRLHGQGLPHLARHGARARRCGSSSGGAEGEPRPSAKELLGEVAKRLGNTVAVCKKSYVHPRVLEALAQRGRRPSCARRSTRPRAAPASSAGERRLLAFLSRRLSGGACQAAARRPTLFPTGRSMMFCRPGPERRHPWKNRSFASAIPAAFARWP